MSDTLPTALVCAQCGTVLGSLFNAPRGAESLKVICESCVTKLSNEKGIKLDSPENWAKLLEN